MSIKETHDIYTVTIDALNQRGQGQAAVWRENEKGNKKKLKLTIPYTLPDEEVKVAVAKYAKRRWEHKAEEIVSPSADRVAAICPHFERCGGCTWQHWTYEKQLQEKTASVKRYLEEQDFSTDIVKDTIGMEEPWYYRNKMEFTFSKDGELGLHEPGNFRNIIPLETCFIMKGAMKEAVLEVANWAKEFELSGYNKETHEGLLRHVMVRQSFATKEMMIGIFATEGPAQIKGIDTLVERITKNHPDVKSLIWLENRSVSDRVASEETHVLAGRDFIYDELMGYRYRLWFDTFFQTNPTQAAKLVELALDMLQPDGSEKMIDLFCGVGTFSLPLASRVKQLIGIEIVETSIESAKRNAADNGITNTHFLAKDARSGMAQIVEEFGTPDVLLLDPPRSGAGGKVMRRIARSNPERIIYVSCNPESFAVDVQQLIPFGYKLEEVQPVDLFPHTFHVELVAMLSRVEE